MDSMHQMNMVSFWPVLVECWEGMNQKPWESRLLETKIRIGKRSTASTIPLENNWNFSARTKIIFKILHWNKRIHRFFQWLLFILFLSSIEFIGYDYVVFGVLLYGRIFDKVLGSVNRFVWLKCLSFLCIFSKLGLLSCVQFSIWCVCVWN